MDSVNNPTDAKDLVLLAFSLLFKADKVEKSIENKKGKDKNKPNSVVKDLLFPTQKDLDGDGTLMERVLDVMRQVILMVKQLDHF